jgi:P4 family phage/plasmid primase-like protien
MRKDKYVCSHVKNNVWYEFRDHRWHELDQGITLRNTISTELHGICLRKSQVEMEKLKTIEQGTDEWAKQKKRIALINDLCKKLKSTSFKNNIMRESQELFYDCNFIEKIDVNPYLLCFQNGVYDFDQKRFRRGNPDDYCMKCTKHQYIELDETKHNKYINEIKQFMYSLFPIKELEEYMWSHLASSLMGINKDHSFHIYTGSGSNGKSMLTEFMTQCLGDYQEQVPITLITQKRNSIGGTSSEVARLHGVRYAVMQEPTKGDRINEGIMKEITGGDPITARHLFKDAFTFKPMFKLVVATNHLFDIKSNDDGTWRRIRVCDFKSKFKDNIDTEDRNEPFQFKKDYNLDKKLKLWAPYFLSMLVKICTKEQGVFPIAPIVQARSNNYRNDQDYLSEFVEEKIQMQDGGKIKKTELYETFKQWYNEQYGKNVPKGKDLYTFMDKRFGKYSSCWKNVEIKYDEEDGGANDGF